MKTGGHQVLDRPRRWRVRAGLRRGRMAADSVIAAVVDLPASTVAARRCPTLGLPALMIFVMRAVGTVTSYPDASTKLRRRPRPAPMCWGHERLVGCPALEPCH